MDSSQARDHLDSVATILRTADRSLNVQPWVFVIWGLFATLLNGLQQAHSAGAALPADSAVQLPMLLIAIVATVLVTLRDGGRETLIDRHAGIVFSVVVAVLLIASFTAQHRVIPYAAMGLFWSFGFAMALLIVGFEASRILAAGGLVLVAASVIACFVPAWFNGVLAAGWLAGLVVPGLLLAWRRSDG
jgi:hypothetical protein